MASKEDKKIPNHVGIIIDGNRRWARERGLPTLEGHRRGLDKLKKVGEWALKRGIKILTVYCFSTENWNRSKVEVSYLMWLFSQSLGKKTINGYHKKGIKIQIIGQKERLSKSLQKKIKKAEELTKNNKKGILNLAISYGGRPEIVQAIKKIIEKKTPANKITEDLINQNLWTMDLPYPDLIIRTGGEMRLSNFLTWQLAYSELYFTKKYWPAITEEDLDKALTDYSRRQRRFGK
jgi:undecaprenyl diphosphate synthase